MIPQTKDNKSLILIRTHQVDDNPDAYSKEARICRGTSRGKPTTPTLLLNFSSHTPYPILQSSSKVESPSSPSSPNCVVFEGVSSPSFIPSKVGLGQLLPFIILNKFSYLMLIFDC